jgi:hypothetical protein
VDGWVPPGAIQWAFLSPAMSAYGGKADSLAHLSACLLIARRRNERPRHELQIHISIIGLAAAARSTHIIRTSNKAFFAGQWTVVSRCYGAWLLTSD